MKLTYIANEKGKGMIHRADCSHLRGVVAPITRTIEADSKIEAIKLIWAEEIAAHPDHVGNYVDKFTHCVNFRRGGF